MLRSGAVVVVLGVVAACSDPPDVVRFASASGDAAGFEQCSCIYYDGSDGAVPEFQITCGDGTILPSIAVFLETDSPGTPQDSLMLVVPHGKFLDHIANTSATYATLGELRSGDEAIKQQVRSVAGLDFAWDAQTVCPVGSACVDPPRIAAGALHAGAGGCEDHFATRTALLGE